MNESEIKYLLKMNIQVHTLPKKCLQYVVSNCPFQRVRTRDMNPNSNSLQYHCCKGQSIHMIAGYQQNQPTRKKWCLKVSNMHKKLSNKKFKLENNIRKTCLILVKNQYPCQHLFQPWLPCQHPSWIDSHIQAQRVELNKVEPAVARTTSLSNLTCINCNRIDTSEEKSDRLHEMVSQSLLESAKSLVMHCVYKNQQITQRKLFMSITIVYHYSLNVVLVILPSNQMTMMFTLQK